MASPRPIGDLLAQLMARRGYAREQSTAALEAAWHQVAGPQWQKHTRAGNVKRGTLEITVANNLLMQELGFSKAELLRKLQQQVPDANVTALRFRVGSVA